MNINKENRLSLAKESLEVALKMLSRFDGDNIHASEIGRILDAAIQATQASQQLNQLVGILQAELGS
jgi:hypothetical protein